MIQYTIVSRIHPKTYPSVCVCVCACVRAGGRACVRALVRACVRVHVMYVTTTTHKYNYLKNVTIGFLMF